MKRSLLDYASISLKGMAIGAVEFLPGISGGTIAFVVGIYEELLDTIKGVLPALKQLLGKKPLKQRITDFWTALNGNFIVALLFGILVAIALTVNIVKHMLEQYPIPFFAFVFGLILASIVLVYKKVSKWTWACYLLGIIGIMLALLLPDQPHSRLLLVPLWYLFICSYLAICAFILPGVSGTFVLFLTGAYYTFVNAVQTLNVTYLAVICAGCLAGLIAFSHVLSWLIKKYHDLTVALLTGFIVGSLKVIWPWKASTSFYITADGASLPNPPKNVLPTVYEYITMQSAMVAEAVIACLLGLVFVLGIEFIAGRISEKRK